MWQHETDTSHALHFFNPVGLDAHSSPFTFGYAPKVYRFGTEGYRLKASQAENYFSKIVSIFVKDIKTAFGLGLSEGSPTDTPGAVQGGLNAGHVSFGSTARQSWFGTK